MKVVFQKVDKWEGMPHAEAELAQRMIVAAKNIGVNAIAASGETEITKFKPDIVFPLFFSIPKLFDAFTVGCMWNPTSMIRDSRNWDNLKTYDGYGVASKSQENLVRSLKFKSPSPYLLTEIYPSTNSTEFNPPKTFKTPVYVGSNWSKERHKEFFLSAKHINVYGPAEKWKYINHRDGIYLGGIPCDGKSVLSVYRNAGIGLALHYQSHNEEGIPSMRPFEIAASGAVMIADRNGFIEEVFGDTVLYLDTTLKTEGLVEQLNTHVGWIRSNYNQAREMAAEAHKIFNTRYSLEVLIKKIIDDVSGFKAKGKNRSKELPKVEILIRSDGEQKNRFFRALDSISQQSYKNIAVIVAYRGDEQSKEIFQQEIGERIPELTVKLIHDCESPDRATQFFSVLRSSKSTFIGFLDHDDVLFHDHVETLVDVLNNYPDMDLGYGGAVKIIEEENNGNHEISRQVGYFHDFIDFEKKSYITSNAYLVRRSKIPWHVLNQPTPIMDCREDRLFLSLLHRQGINFIFSEKITSAFYWFSRKQGHSGETDEILSIGERAYALILNNARLPWQDPSQVAPPRRFIFYSAIKAIIEAIKNDVDHAIICLKNIIK